LIQLPPFLLEGNHHVPAQFLGKPEHGSLRVQGIQQQNIEEAWTVDFAYAPEQAQGCSVLPFSGLEPFDGQQGLERTADDLAADGAVVILDALLHATVRLRAGDTTFQAGFTATAIAGKDFNAVQRRHDSTLHPPRVEGFIAF
jgi:hypothetical protein